MTSYPRSTSLELDTVILLACDQPLVDSSTIASLVEQRESSAKPIVTASYAVRARYSCAV
jgi:molybdopterin-guanine dinucleotide biosynthesis protein A